MTEHTKERSILLYLSKWCISRSIRSQSGLCSADTTGPRCSTSLCLSLSPTNLWQQLIYWLTNWEYEDHGYSSTTYVFTITELVTSFQLFTILFFSLSSRCDFQEPSIVNFPHTVSTSEFISREPSLRKQPFVKDNNFRSKLWLSWWSVCCRNMRIWIHISTQHSCKVIGSAPHICNHKNQG